MDKKNQPITHTHRIRIIELMAKTEDKNIGMFCLRVARILDMLPIDDNSEILRTATADELFSALKILLSIIIKRRDNVVIGDPNYSNYNIHNIFLKQWTPFAVIYCLFITEDPKFNFNLGITTIAEEILCDAIIQTFIDNRESAEYAMGVGIAGAAAAAPAPTFEIPPRNYQCDLYKTVKETLNYIIKIMLIKLEENSDSFPNLRPYAQFLPNYDDAKAWVNAHILSGTASNLLEIHTTNPDMLNNALEYEVKKATHETYSGYRRRWIYKIDRSIYFYPAEAFIDVDARVEGANPYLAERRGDDNKRHLLNSIIEMDLGAAPLSSAQKYGAESWDALTSKAADVTRYLRDFTGVGGRSLRKKRDKRSRRTEKKLRKRKNTYYKRYK